MSTSTHVAFVRAVMIGREGLHGEVLLDMFRRAGASDPVSYLATGNVSFRIEEARLEATIEHVESALEQLLGRPTPLFVRSLDALRSLVDAGLFDDPPFPEVRDRILLFFRHELPGGLHLPIAHPGGDWSVFATGPAELAGVTRAWRDGHHPGAPGGVVERLSGEPITSRALSTVERIVSKLS